MAWARVPGPGIGTGFGGFIGELRRKGLDIVLVIDDTGTMDLIINDVRDRMDELVMAIHRLVPIARVGIVGLRRPQPTHGNRTADHLEPSAGDLSEQRGRQRKSGSQGDVYAACVTAVNQMNWKPYAKKVIVLVGDSPPRFEDYGPLLSLITRFRAQDGTFNTIDVSAEEHERYEREFWLKTHSGRPPGESISPLAEFYQDTRETYKMLAAAGGGGMRPLTQNVHINEQVLILALGAQWQGNLAAFGRQITENEQWNGSSRGLLAAAGLVIAVVLGLVSPRSAVGAQAISQAQLKRSTTNSRTSSVTISAPRKKNMPTANPTSTLANASSTCRAVDAAVRLSFTPSVGAPSTYPTTAR